MSLSFDVNDFEGLNLLTDDVKQSIKILFVFNDRNDKPPYNISGKNTIFVTDKDELHVFGKNTLGSLGLKHKNLVNAPFQSRELSYRGFNNFFNGCHHVIAITDKQEVYSWGYNNFGQLGTGTIESASLGPVKNDLLSQRSIVNVSCGDWHTLALTAKGEVYAWGNNSSGQIGIDKKDKTIAKPVKLELFLGHKITAISCGSAHSIALTQNGLVFSWGANNSGQLGIGTLKNSIEPKIIDLHDIPIKRISCGPNYSFLLSHDGYIHAFGDVYLQGSQNPQKTPFKMPSSVDFREIASIISLSFSIALSKDDECYLLGKIGSNTLSSPKSTEFKSFQDYYTNEYKITLTTINTKKSIMKQPTTIEVKPEISNKNSPEKKLFKNDDLRPLQNQTANRAQKPEQFETAGSNAKDNVSFHNSRYTKYFQQLDCIGVGGYGSVYKALNTFEDQHYAIKKINLKGLSKEKKDFALKEIKTMAQLQNEFVVQYKASWIEDTTHTLLIQMELCLMTLKHVIEGKQTQFKRNSGEVMSPIECYLGCEIFKEIAECLEFLHKLNPPIMHRDLKPQNILISKGSNRRFVKLGDFGLAKLHTNEEESHTQGVGTFRYTAPEVLQNNKYGTSADIYSFGVITQELFDINIDSSRQAVFTKNSISDEIYPKFFDLIREMTERFRLTRPSSEKLIKKISLIQPTYEEITNDSEFNALTDQFKKIEKIEENFIVFFLRIKLEPFIKNK